MRLGMRRIAAWLVDWLCILIWVAITAAVGVPLYLNGITSSAGMLTANLVGAVVVVVPVVLAAAFVESRRFSATPGKRLLGLRLRCRSGQPRFHLALIRNLLKIGLPWILGHAAVYALARTDTESFGLQIWVWIVAVAANVIPLVYVVTLFLADGRTPYDRITGTDVVLIRPPRRVEFRPSH